MATKTNKQPITPDATIKGLHGQLKAIMARELERLPRTVRGVTASGTYKGGVTVVTVHDAKDRNLFKRFRGTVGGDFVVTEPVVYVGFL